jgi:sec-independent protein translocase protein TatA
LLLEHTFVISRRLLPSTASRVLTGENIQYRPSTRSLVEAEACFHAELSVTKRYYTGGTPGEFMGELLQPTHLLMILAVALLVFGPKKLPDLGKGLGEGLRGFKDAIKGIPAATRQDTPSPSVELPVVVK